MNWRRVDRLYVDLAWARPGSFNAYLLAILLSAIATALRVGLDGWLVGVQFITAYPAIIFLSLVCGARAGLLGVVLCTAGTWYFVMAERGSFELARAEQGATILLFAATAAIIVLLIGAMRLAISRYRQLSMNLHRRVEQRTSELEAAQARLAQSQKMEALGQMTGGIAHDFNNMLAVVLGNLEMAQRRLASGRMDVSRQIENASEGGRRAAALTQRLLAFSRRQPLEPEVADANRLLGDLMELLRRTLGETIRIQWSPSQGLWPACVDPAQLESAVINLAVNARDAMPEGGTLRIATANRLLPGEGGAPDLEAGDYVEILVADSGCGMAPDVRQRAFEPFFTTKDVGRGTGLGLSQVYGFIRQSGGDVAIDSREGEGTEIRLFLPRHEGEGPTAAGAEVKSALPHGSPGEVVLVVEDEDQVRRTTIEAMIELGYGVREARGGVEALAILASDPSVRLLFTDVVMPGLDGRELAERAMRQRPDLKLLYTSGYTGEGAASGIGGGGPPAELLAKPFTLDQLARKIREALDAEGPEPPL